MAIYIYIYIIYKEKPSKKEKKMKLIYTPHTGDFKTAYKNKKEYKKIEDIIKDLIKYQKEILNVNTTKNQYFIEWYSYNKNLNTDRFIIIFKNYTTKEVSKYPVGFIHYET